MANIKIRDLTPADFGDNESGNFLATALTGSPYITRRCTFTDVVSGGSGVLSGIFEEKGGGGSTYSAGTGLTLVGTEFNTAGSGVFDQVSAASGIFTDSLTISGVSVSTGAGGGGGTPGGSDTQIQFNDGGSFSGSPDFIYEESIDKFTLDPGNAYLQNLYITGAGGLWIRITGNAGGGGGGGGGGGTPIEPSFVDETFFAPWEGTSPGDIYYTAGNIAIGNTTVEGGNLHINDDAGGEILLTRTNTTTDGRLGELRFGDSTTDQDLARISVSGDGSISDSRMDFYTQNGGTPESRMTIRSDGDVGINTDDPQTQLDVSGTLSCSHFIINSDHATEGAQIALNFGGSQGGESSTAYSIDVLKDVGNLYGHGADMQLLRIFYGTASEGTDSNILNMSTGAAPGVSPVNYVSVSSPAGVLSGVGLGCGQGGLQAYTRDGALGLNCGTLAQDADDADAGIWFRASTGQNPYNYANFGRWKPTDSVTQPHGYLGIATDSPTRALHMGVDDAYKATALWDITSDARLKKDIADFSSGLDVLSHLQPRTFRFNGEGGIADTGATQVGLIAQEAAPHAPYLFKQDEANVSGQMIPVSGMKGSALIYLLINSVKELKTENDDLRARLDAGGL
jgi:hypothetical protein